MVISYVPFTPVSAGSLSLSLILPLVLPPPVWSLCCNFCLSSSGAAVAPVSCGELSGQGTTAAAAAGPAPPARPPPQPRRGGFPATHELGPPGLGGWRRGGTRCVAAFASLPAAPPAAANGHRAPGTGAGGGARAAARLRIMSTGPPPTGSAPLPLLRRASAAPPVTALRVAERGGGGEEVWRR